MRKILFGAEVAAALALGMFVPRGQAAPALGDRPIKYEYAELRYSRGLAAPPGLAAAQLQGFGRAAGVAAAPPVAAGGAPQPAVAQVTVRWTTAEEEIVLKEWEELADKLKAPTPKKESPATVHKLRVLNKLSADGWELLDRSPGDTASGTWTFRRRVP